jgi:hypothetical protein
MPDLPSAYQVIVVGMGAYPEPGNFITVFVGKGAPVKPDSDGVYVFEALNGLELQTAVVGLSLPKTVGFLCGPLH